MPELTEPKLAKPGNFQPDSKISSTRGPVVFGLTLIITAFGGFGLWASTAPLESAVAAPGVVVVESSRKVVQHLEGGIVKQILVSDGDYINKGEPVLILDSTKPKAVLEIIQGQYYNALALEARLLAERIGAPAITFPDELLQITDEQVEQIIQGQVQLFEARKHALSGEIDILQQQIAQYREEISGLQAQQVARENQIELFEKELVGLDKLLSQGNIAENFVLDKKRQLANLKGEQGKYKADVARARQGIGEAELKISQIKKNLQEAVERELGDIQATIADLRERLVAAKDVMERTTVIAPASGVVIGMSFHTVGGVIGPGNNILEIVPQDEELIFEARVQTTDVDDIEIGQRATVRLTAFSFRHTLLIEGEVIHASADSLTDPQTGATYYAVKIRVSKEELTKLRDARLHPGMPVEALIKTGERTMLQYITSPIKDSLSRAFIEK